MCRPTNQIRRFITLDVLASPELVNQSDFYPMSDQELQGKVSVQIIYGVLCSFHFLAYQNCGINRTSGDFMPVNYENRRFSEEAGPGITRAHQTFN